MTLIVKKNRHPDYVGMLVVEVPDKLFNYYAGEKRCIDGGEIEEVIELISDYREKPEK